MANPARLYAEDYLAWTEHQAGALRAAGSLRHGSNQPLDWENLAEEVESLGQSQRHALASHLANVIEHLIKLEHSPASDPRAGWRSTVRRERAAVERLLEKSPSLKSELAATVASESRRAVRLAAEDLLERNEISRAEYESLQGTSYTEDQALGDWWPARRDIQA